MNKKIKKGFTLTELIVVIAIIAILAAVLIPTSISFIKKAKISNGEQAAAGMTRVLQAQIIVEDLTGKELSIGEVRYLINSSQEKSLNYNSNVKGYAYWFNENENKIVFSKYDDVMNMVSAAADETSSLEDIYEKGMALIDDSSSDIAKTLYSIRNLNYITEFEGLKNTLISLGVTTEHIELFSPANTLYINNSFQLTSSTTSVKRVIFADGIKTIPAVVNPVAIDETVTVYVPSSVKTIETSSDSNTNAFHSTTNIIANNSKIKTIDLATVKLNITYYDYYNNEYKKIEPINDTLRLKGKLVIRLEKEYNETVFNSNPRIEIKDEIDINTNKKIYVFKTYVNETLTGYASVIYSESTYNSNYSINDSFKDFYTKMNLTEAYLNSNVSVKDELQRIFNSCSENGNVKIELN